MDKYTFGNSQAAQNLVSDILEQPQYQPYKEAVCRRLSKQTARLKAVMTIRDKTIREETLRMWHKTFVPWTEGLPELVKTHIRCVETGIYRQFLKS